MKILLKSVLGLILIAFLGVGTGFAQAGSVNVVGEIIELDDSTDLLVIETKKGDSYTLAFEEEVDLSMYAAGEYLLVKGVIQEDGSLLVERMKQVGKKDSDDGDADDGEEETSGKLSSAYCLEGKKDNPHPFAVRLAEKYGVTEEWVMGYFCDGFGMGAIMLALITGEKSSNPADDLLNERADGKGWGQIWKGLGLIGAEKDGESPPGHLKRPEHAGPKDKDK